MERFVFSVHFASRFQRLRVRGGIFVVHIFRLSVFLILTAALFAFPTITPTAVAQDDDEKPYQIEPDGTVDWYVYSGFRRYHSECHVCHGPDGLGSSFAPPLADSLQRLSYDDFVEVIVNGRENVSRAGYSKMPAFGVNPNVVCFLDDIYAYLKARSDGVLPRGRPPKRQPKPQEAREHEDACMG